MANQDYNPQGSPDTKGPPAGYFLVVPPSADPEQNDAIDLAKTAARLAKHWKLLLVTCLLGAGIAAGISLRMRNVYRAQAVISPTQESGSGNNSVKNTLGGIAELAGIDIGGGGGRKVEAIATLKSHGFVRDFILANNLMPILYGERWDAEAKTWRKGATPPTMEMAVKRFLTKCTIDENNKTGLITIRFDWYSPELAAEWINSMVDMVNERMRTIDINTAEKSLEYLNKEMANANAVELRMAISQLMETQVNNEMVAKVQRDYAYHFIDRAVPPQSKEGPKRTVMTIGGAVIGLILGIAYIVLRRRAELVPRTQ